MNAKCIEGADPPDSFVELGELMDPGIIERLNRAAVALAR